MPDLRNVVAEDAPVPIPLPPGGFNIAQAPSMGDMLGGLGNLLYQAITFPKNAVQTAIAGSPENFAQQAAERAPGLAQIGGLAAQSGLLGPQHVVAGAMFRGLPKEMQAGAMQLLQESASDPLNYFGFGIPGGAAKLIPQGSRLASLLPVLNALDRGERGASKLIEQAILAPFKAAGAAAGKLPVHMPVYQTKDVPLPSGVMDEAVIRRQSTDLLDYLNSTSAESGYRMGIRKLAEATAELVDNDYNIGRAVVNAKDIAEGKFLPNFNPGSKAWLTRAKTYIQNAHQQLEAKYTEAPNGAGRAAWVEVMRQTELMNAHAWEQARLAYRDGIAAGGTPAARKQLATQMYASATDQIVMNMKAAEDTLEDVFAAARKLQLDPVTDNWLTTESHQAISAVRNAQNTPTIGLFAVDTTKPRGAADKQRIAYDEMLRRVNAIGQVADDLTSKVQAAATPETALLIEPQAILGRMQNRLSEIDLLKQGLPGEVALLPSDLQGPTLNAHRKLVQYASDAIRTKNLFEDALEQVWQKFSPGVPYPRMQATGQTTSQEILDHINQVLPQLGLPSNPGQVRSSIDLLEQVIAPYADSAVFTKLDEAVQRFPGVDVLTASPLRAAYDRAARSLGAQYGIKEDRSIAGVLGSALKLLDALFKENALTSLSYPLVNTLGATANNALSGASPLSTVTNALRQSLRALRDPEGYHPAQHIQNFIDATGIRPGGPATGRAGGILETSSDVRNYTHTGQQAWERFGLPGMLGVGASVGAIGGNAQTPEDATHDERLKNIILGSLIGGTALGGVHPAMNKFFITRVSKGIEDAARGEIWLHNALDAHQAAAGEYRAILQDALGQTQQRRLAIVSKDKKGLPVEGEIRTKINPQAAQRVLDFVEGQNYLLTPEAVAAILREYDVPANVAQRVMTKWRNLNARVGQVGEDAAARVQFDYENLTNLEQFFKDFTPFSTWAMKAIPFWARTLGEHPQILAAVAAYTKMSEAARQDSGLTQKVSGAFHPGGFPDQFWSAMLGHPVMAYYNPLRGMVPFSDTIRQSQEQPGEMPMETINRLLNLVGLPGMAPGIQLAGRISGLAGDAPPQGLIRTAGPLQGITAALGVNRGRGIDINAGITAPERALREKFGQEVADPELTQTMARVDELFLRNTGKPIGSGGPLAVPYLQAKAAQTGPIWEQAAREIAKDRGLRSTAGWLFGPAAPQAFVTPEEEAIRFTRKESRLLEPRLSQQIAEAGERNPNGKAPQAVIDAITEASKYMMQQLHPENPALPPRVIKALELGTNREMAFLRKELLEAQTLQNPLAGGYGQSGGPNEAKLQVLLDLMGELPGTIPGGGFVSQLNAMKGKPGEFVSAGTAIQNMRVPSVLQPTAQAVQQLKDATRAGNPLLDEYLKWKQANPDGRIETFLKQYRAR